MADDFEQFWAASRLTTLTQRRLTDRLADYRPPADALDPFTLPTAYHPLARPRDVLHRLYANRRSAREFGSRPLTARMLGRVLDALAAADDGRRGYPSAGGLNPLRCYPVLGNVRHPLNGRVTRYDPDSHALQEVRPAPSWPELAPMVGAVPDEPGPAVALVFVLADLPMLAKYGARGGRFGLIEAGGAMQNVALRLSRHRLAGYLLGGAVDAEVLGLAGLSGQPVRLAGVLLCGRTSRRDISGGKRGPRGGPGRSPVAG